MKVKTSLDVEDGVRRYIFASCFRSITLGMESNMTVKPAKIPAGYIMVRVLLYSSFTSPLQASHVAVTSQCFTTIVLYSDNLLLWYVLVDFSIYRSQSLTDLDRTQTGNNIHHAPSDPAIHRINGKTRDPKTQKFKTRYSEESFCYFNPCLSKWVLPWSSWIADYLIYLIIIYFKDVYSRGNGAKSCV